MQAVDRFNDAARLHGEKNTVVTLQAVNQAIQDVMTANQNKTAAENNLLNVGNASQQDINIIRQARQRMQQIRLELGFKVDDHLWNNLAPPGLNQQAQQQAAQQAAQQQATQQAQQQAAQQAQQQAAQQAAQQAQQQAAQQALLIHQGPQQFAAQLALQAQQQVQAQNAAANNNNNNSVYASFSQALADQYEGVGAPLD